MTKECLVVQSRGLGGADRTTAQLNDLAKEGWNCFAVAPVTVLGCTLSYQLFLVRETQERTRMTS
jgi:hypothetical protein